jgi:hypothetical protein
LPIGLADEVVRSRGGNAPDPPNLKGTALARSANPRLRMNLEELDRFHTLNNKDDK